MVRRVPCRIWFSAGAPGASPSGDDALVILKGDISRKEFWSVDLQTGRERQLTALGGESVIGDFDLSPDGRAITFDRTREESDIVLFDLPEQ